MNKITIYQSVTDGGDETPYIKYFLTVEGAEKDQKDSEDTDSNYAEDVIEVIETFEGSNIHLKAKEHEETKKEESKN